MNDSKERYKMLSASLNTEEGRFILEFMKDYYYDGTVANYNDMSVEKLAYNEGVRSVYLSLINYKEDPDD